MKRRDLVRALTSIAQDRGIEFELLRQGANHEVWSLGGHRIVIPRHREINERTAEGIIDRAQKADKHGSDE